MPAEEIVPALAVHVTAELNAPVPNTLNEHEEIAPTLRLVGEQLTETEVMLTEVVIAIVVEADFVVSCVEVAVIVAVPEDGAVAGAV
jgi:hypothetical protein